MLDLILALLVELRFEYGHAAYYSEGVMEQVVAVRQAGWAAGSLPVSLPPVVGFVAVPDCAEIGGLIWLFYEGEGWSGPYLIADCANKTEKHDVEMRKRDIVVEIDNNTARRWGVLGLGPADIPVVVVR